MSAGAQAQLAALAADPRFPAIVRAYAGRRARRSGLPYLHHVVEGALLLGQALGADHDTVVAFCLHPLFQDDASLAALDFEAGPLAGLEPRIVVWCMEYRALANAYTSRHPLRAPVEVPRGPLPQVEAMLVADKVQNTKDFLAHVDTAEGRSGQLRAYFDSWLAGLGVDAARYRQLAARLEAWAPLVARFVAGLERPGGAKGLSP